MKKTYLLLLSCLIIGLSACEKVIDIDLKNVKPVIVIEASVTDMLRQQVVKISQTKPFTEDNSVVAVNNAVVTLKDLTENVSYGFSSGDGSGKYLSQTFRGKEGHTYELVVKSENKTYSAQSTMPKKVMLDSLSISELTLFGETQKFLKLHFMDPPEYTNQYNYVLKINGETRNAYYVDSDRFSNGKYNNNLIFQKGDDLKFGDAIELEFQCIDMPIYRYFFALSQISGNGGPPTAPSNPDSNFNNGALGYFSAHTLQIKSALIK